MQFCDLPEYFKRVDYNIMEYNGSYGISNGKLIQYVQPVHFSVVYTHVQFVHSGYILP